MRTNDTVRLALRNLGQAKLRTALTTMGVSIGIASLAGMVSLGVGLQDQVVGQFARSGVFDAITVTSARPQAGRAAFGGRGGPFGGARRGGGRRGTGAASDPATPAPPEVPKPLLDDEGLAKIAAIPSVKDVYPTIRVPMEISYDQFSEVLTAAGIPMSSKDEGAFRTFAHGGFFANDTDRVCMLSLDLAKRISEADPGGLVGKSLTVTYAASTSAPVPAGGEATPIAGIPFQVAQVETQYRVVGIVEREPSSGFGGGILVTGFMIPLAQAKAIDATVVTNAQSLLRGPSDKKEYNAVTVKVTHAQNTQDVEDKIKELGYSAFSINDALEGAKRGFIILDIVLSLIGSIALAVSSLGIVNTMVMSILERTREIGIMKAVGGSDVDVRGIFLVEASTIGMMGGVAGVILGWLVGRAINFGANIYIQSQGGTPANLFSLPWWLIGGAIAFSVLVSLVAGSYPASRAAKLDPIQALRHD